MTDIVNEIKDIIDSWDSEELINLKKEVALSIVEKISKNKGEPLTEENKKIMIDYLVDEKTLIDKVSDFFIGVFWDSSVNNLKEYRQKLNKIDTKESLDILKNEILSELDNDHQNSLISIDTNSSPENEPKSNDKNLEKVINIAESQLNKKYTWGGISPSTSFDCSGLWYYAYKTAGIQFPHRYTAIKFSKETPRIGWNKVKRWDFMFWDAAGKKKHSPVYHIEMALTEPYKKSDWHYYIKTFGSSSDKWYWDFDCKTKHSAGVKYRERRVDDKTKHFTHPDYSERLDIAENSWNNNVLDPSTPLVA